MRIVTGIAAGAAVIAVSMLALLVPLFLILGPDRAVAAQTLEFTNLWLGIAMGISLGAAALGGWIAHAASGRVQAVAGLAALVLIAGLSDAAWHQWGLPGASVAAGQLSALEWLVGLREPAWYDWSLPVLMAVFVWVAGSGRATEQN